MRLVSGLAFASIIFASSVASAQGQTIVVQPPPPAGGQPPPPEQQPQPPPTAAQPAQPPPPPPPKEKKKQEKEWYGWQTLAADAGAFVLMGACQATKVYSIFDVGLGAYFLGPPIVHIVHGNAGQAFGSLGLRLVTPWVTGAIGAVVGVFFLSGTDKDPNKCHEAILGGVDCSTPGATHDYVTGPVILFPKEEWARPIAYGWDVGFMAGYAMVLGIDAFLIAYEKVDDVEYGKAKPPPPPTVFTLSPKINFGPGRASVGVGGQF